MLLLGIPIGITGVVGSLVGIGRVSMRFSGRGRLLNRWRGHWALPDGLEQVELILVERAVAATMRIEDSPSISVGRLAEVHDARRLAEVLWQIFERARQVSELRRAIGSSPFDADESLVDLLAPAVSAVAQAANSLRTRVEEVEQYRDCVARADAAHATLLRLREVDTSNERVAEIITSMNWDRPSLDSTLLSDRIAATEENWATLITEAAEHWPAP
jgi:hypothetical protein